MNHSNMTNQVLSNFLNPNDWYSQNNETMPLNENFQNGDFLNKMTPSQNLATPEEGYRIGNLFIESYIPYKNYTPQKLIAQNEQGRLFLALSEVAFASHDLNLYLDLHPNDQEKLALFNQYRKQKNELMRQYENQYGPITIDSNVLENSPFLWEQLPFPWEGGRK